MKHACLKTAHKSLADHDFSWRRTTSRACRGERWPRSCRGPRLSGRCRTSTR